MLENIEVGARGWACADYYPDDLPEAWQLDYYANDFSSLLVPQLQWQRWEKDDWEAFADSADTLVWIGFELVEMDGAPVVRLAEALADLQAILPAQLGVLADGDGALDLPAHVAVTRRGAESASTEGWRWQDLCGDPLGYVEALPQDAKAQRTLLEDFAASLPDKNHGAPFIVAGGCANIGQLKQFKQLAELLGL